MNRRVVGVVVSIVLAAAGTWLITNYVREADARALEGQEAVKVLVVEQGIPRGTPASVMADRVRTIEVARHLSGPNTIESLDEVEGLVAAVDFLPGELLQRQRFVEESNLQDPGDFDVPDDLVEVTVALPAERAVGGTLRPGDRVAFVASFNPFTLDAVEPTENDLSEFIGDDETNPQPLSTPNTTHIILHKALVVRVQAPRDALAQQSASGVSSDQAIPADNQLVTLAVTNPDVEKIVFTKEFGLVWLAREGANASEEGTRVQTRGTIYR